MKKLPYVLIAGAALMFWVSPALGVELQVYYEDGPQDPLYIPENVHEVGDGPNTPGPFPPGEIIISSWTETWETACTAWPYDDPNIVNVLVEITRVDIRVDPQDPNGPVPVWYVADPETTLSNYDGWIGNLGLLDAEEAFRIDHVGVNQPLVYESMGWNNLLEYGETWRFIIQDYQNACGGPPAPFDSIGIASLSCGWPPSTGSLLVPEPTTLGLLVMGGVALLRRRRE